MDFRFQLVFGLACLSSTIFAQSRNCVVDKDLNDVQEYSYKVPKIYQTDAFTYEGPYRIKRAKNNQVNYYTFGKFGDLTTSDDTTITAGIYKGDDLIYKTEINCDGGMWKNTVLNTHGKEKTILSGNIDKNLTTYRPGDTFDLILKVNNWYAMNWIFNAQPLQHDIKTVQYEVFSGDKKISANRTRPAVRAWSKHPSYQATRFVLTATGRAKFDRFVFGQCDAWPKGLAKFDNYCQRVYFWSYARSKARTEKVTREENSRRNFAKGLPNSLGVFGNNRLIHLPLCFTKKYFYFFMHYVHPDRKIPMKVEGHFGDKKNNKYRAYCCNIDIFTGQILKNDPKKYCYGLDSCRYNLLDEAALKIISETDPDSIVRKEQMEILKSQERPVHYADEESMIFDATAPPFGKN